MQKIIWIIFLILSFLDLSYAQINVKPDFEQIPAGKERSKAFVSYMLPVIKTENEKICSLRQELIMLQKKIEQKRILTDNQKNKIKQTSSDYHLDFSNISEANISAILSRVNIVPISMVLSQAAVESGWGTSRFARNANSYFGEHCFEKGCGVKARNDSTVEVSKFSSLAASIQSYYKMLNTRSAFHRLRSERQKEQSQNVINVSVLIKTLNRYSSLGKKYPKILMSVIKSNDLIQYDTDQLCM